MDYIDRPAQHPMVRDVQRFQHPTTHIVDRYGRIIDQPVISGGEVIDPPPPTQLVTVGLGGEFVAVTSTPTPLKGEQYLTRSIIVQSIKSDGTNNTGIVWIGGMGSQVFGIRVGGTFTIEAPNGRILDLNKIYLKSDDPSAQVSFTTID